jgi:hypothetical protein
MKTIPRTPAPMVMTPYQKRVHDAFVAEEEKYGLRNPIYKVLCRPTQAKRGEKAQTDRLCTFKSMWPRPFLAVEESHVPSVRLNFVPGPHLLGRSQRSHKGSRKLSASSATPSGRLEKPSRKCPPRCGPTSSASSRLFHGPSGKRIRSAFGSKLDSVETSKITCAC